MTENLTESAWKPIKLGNKGQGGYSLSKQAVSAQWYQNYLDNSGARFNRLSRYDEADSTSVEIARALDVLAEDISSSNADDKYTYTDTYPDETKTNKTTQRLISEAIRMWGGRTGFDDRLFERVRRTLKYGATFYRKHPDGSTTELKTERMVGYILSPNDDTTVTHYIYDPKGQTIRTAGSLVQNLKMSGAGVKNDQLEIIPVSDLVVLKTSDEPFGLSVIEKVYKTWRQMTLIEDSVIIYRVVRAPERRIFYVDVGNLQGPKREAAIEKQRIRLMQKNATKGGELTAEYDPHSTGEDIFIPTNSTGKGSRIETLPGGQNLGEIADLEFFSKKLAAGLRIPNSMIDTHGEQSQSQFSDMRVGQMYQIEMRYMGHVKRFQRRIVEPLFKNFCEFCMDRDIKVPEDLKFSISEPMSFAIYKEMEINQTQLNVYNSSMQIETLSKKFSLQKYLGLEADDLAHNEECRLIEMGVSAEDIKKMDQYEVDNLVYGKPKAETLEKYGIEAQDDGMGRF